MLNRNGMVTTTLLLATTNNRVPKKFVTATSLPAPKYISIDEEEEEEETTEEFLTNEEIIFRMPCKMSVKRKIKRRKRRHSSLPGISGRRKTQKLKNIQKQQNNYFYHSRTTSSPIGILRKATARALALKNQFMRSRSSSNFERRKDEIKKEENNLKIQDINKLNERRELLKEENKKEIKNDKNFNFYIVCNTKEINV
uniref:Uncharacterized protein n=1 Tax=Meloidogyne enterolobii TaxID=390850 RepID=A0A6V7UWV4_MELEN|nr:unnamed protein product [Meloidogyne enterolobii]